MATQLKLYRSSDVGAPTLSGTAGDLTNLLDKCLVSGYGALAGAGWSIAFTDGSNRRIYQQGSGSAVYFRVRDDAGGTGGAKEALIKGGEVWTDVNTCTVNPFPSVAQSALTDNSLIVRKSTAASATVRVWTLLADSKTCYLFVQTGDTANTYYTVAFGDFYSVVPVDAYAACLIARAAENDGTTNNEVFAMVNYGEPPASWTNIAGHYSQRNFGGGGGSTPFMKLTSNFGSAAVGTTATWDGGLTYPNPADGSLWLARVFHCDPTTGGSKSRRGWLRGVWAPCHPATNFTDQIALAGSGQLAGRNFLVIKAVQAGTSATCVFMETSATVE